MDLAFGKAYHNLSAPSLVEVIIKRKEGMLSSTGALSVKTGKFTGRPPDDRYIVDDEETHNTIDWGKVNHPDRKSTRLNSSHANISYAVFCLTKQRCSECSSP